MFVFGLWVERFGLVLVWHVCQGSMFLMAEVNAAKACLEGSVGVSPACFSVAGGTPTLLWFAIGDAPDRCFAAEKMSSAFCELRQPARSSIPPESKIRRAFGFMKTGPEFARE